jgi:hypothetical protein
MSFGELMQAARQQAAALRALGLAPGDRGRDDRPGAAVFRGHIPRGGGRPAGSGTGLPPSSLAKLDSWQQSVEAIIRVTCPLAIVTVDEVCPLLWSAPGRTLDFDISVPENGDM